MEPAPSSTAGVGVVMSHSLGGLTLSRSLLVAGCARLMLVAVVYKLGDVKGEVTIELIDYWRRASSVASSLLLLLQ